MVEQIISDSRFQFGKKWFWIGMVVALNLMPGLIFGIALMTEKERRKEGTVIAIFAIAWFIFAAFVLGPWLQRKGILPKYRLFRMN